MPSPSQRPSDGELLDGEGVAVAGRLGDQRPGDRVGIAAGPLEQVGGQQRAGPRRGPRLAHQRRAAGVHLEAAAVAAAAAGCRPGTTRMCPISAPTPKAPRYSEPSRTTPPPTPVPTVTSRRSSTSWPAPNWNSPHAAAFASFSTTTGRPSVVLEVGLEVEVAPGQVGREQHDRRAPCRCSRRRPTPTASIGWRVRSSVTSFSIAASMAGTSVAGDSTRSSSRIVPVLVDDAAGDLGAADVDAAGQAHRRRPPASRRPRRRRGRSARRRSSRAGGRVAIIPETASINDDAALARWARTSGLVCRIAATVRQTGHQAHSGDPVARCSWRPRSTPSTRPSPRRRRRARVAQPERAPKQLRGLLGDAAHRLRAVGLAHAVRLTSRLVSPRFAPRRTSPAARPRPRGRRRPDGGPARRAG